MRIISLAAVFLLWPVLLLCEKLPDSKVFGSVMVPVNPPLKVDGATILFRAHDGTEIRAATNSKGHYETVLESGKEYNVTLSSMGMYTMHRPAFRPATGKSLRFDFLTIPATFINRVTNDPAHQRPNATLPYRDEETMAIGKRPAQSLIIAFGILNKGKNRVTYEGLPIAGYEGKTLPVIISYETYTIHADTATLKQKPRVLKVDGNVSIADGSDSPPKLTNCVMLQLDQSNPKPQQCRPRAGNR